MIRSSSYLSILLTAFAAVAILLHPSAVGVDAAPAFLSRKKTYTPLLFFKVPQGTMDECDEMEKMIQSLEKEQRGNIRVQRLDIVRDRAARKLYEKLVEGNLRSPFPLLYHRESLQRVYGLADNDIVRSWSKGRLLPAPEEEDDNKEATVLGGGGGEEDEMMDMEELEMEMDAELTPMQRRGKEAMKRRMDEARTKTKD